MTYRELYEKAEWQLEKGKITIGEFDEMTKPLNEEIRPHGEWEFIGENLFMCTKCGYIADANYLEKWKAHTFDSNFPDFCPNCGADMREGETREE